MRLNALRPRGVAGAVAAGAGPRLLLGRSVSHLGGRAYVRLVAGLGDPGWFPAMCCVNPKSYSRWLVPPSSLANGSWEAGGTSSNRLLRPVARYRRPRSELGSPPAEATSTALGATLARFRAGGNGSSGVAMARRASSKLGFENRQHSAQQYDDKPCVMYASCPLSLSERNLRLRPADSGLFCSRA